MKLVLAVAVVKIELAVAVTADCMVDEDVFVVIVYPLSTMTL